MVEENEGERRVRERYAHYLLAHGTGHDEKDHGNWADGGVSDEGDGGGSKRVPRFKKPEGYELTPAEIEARKEAAARKKELGVKEWPWEESPGWGSALSAESRVKGIKDRVARVEKELKGWKDVLEGGVDYLEPASAGNFWVTSEGKWARVDHHGTYWDYAMEAKAIRAVVNAREVNVEISERASADQLEVIAIASVGKTLVLEELDRYDFEKTIEATLENAEYDDALRLLKKKNNSLKRG